MSATLRRYLPASLPETRTFRRVAGRWHVAVLCADCRDPIFFDVHERELDVPAGQRCGRCEKAGRR